MPQVAIICSVIPARYALLNRSVQTWQQSIRRSGLNAAIYIWNEGGQGDEITHLLRYQNVHIVNQLGFSGSHIPAYNYWHKAVQADTYIFTHPDLLFPWNTVMEAHKHSKDDTFVAFKSYFMPPDMTRDLDQYDWKNPEYLERVPELYNDDDYAHGTFYCNRGIKAIQTWESSTTYSVNMQTSKRMFPLPDFGHQGADDPYQAGLRLKLGIKNYTVMNPILFHQWHPNTWHGTPQEAQDTMRGRNCAVKPTGRKFS